MSDIMASREYRQANDINNGKLCSNRWQSTETRRIDRSSTALFHRYLLML